MKMMVVVTVMNLKSSNVLSDIQRRYDDNDDHGVDNDDDDDGCGSDDSEAIQSPV